MAATIKSVFLYNARNLARDYYFGTNFSEALTLNNTAAPWHVSPDASFTTAIILSVFALLGVLLAAIALLKALTQLSLR